MIVTPTNKEAEERWQFSLTYNEHSLKIGTLNVKGFNAIDKQLVSFSIFRLKHYLDIIGLTETKTKKNENKFLSQIKNIQKKGKNQKTTDNNNIENIDNLEKQPAESSIDKQTPDRD